MIYLPPFLQDNKAFEYTGKRLIYTSLLNCTTQAVKEYKSDKLCFFLSLEIGRLGISPFFTDKSYASYSYHTENQ